MDDLRAAVREASASVRGDAGAGTAEPKLERPKRQGQGDYSTNAAMLLAPALGEAPREVAQRIGEELSSRLGSDLERVRRPQRDQ